MQSVEETLRLVNRTSLTCKLISMSKIRYPRMLAKHQETQHQHWKQASGEFISHDAATLATPPPWRTTRQGQCCSRKVTSCCLRKEEGDQG